MLLESPRGLCVAAAKVLSAFCTPTRGAISGHVPVSVLCFRPPHEHVREGPRSYADHITADPRILASKPVVRGTRVAVSLVLESLGAIPCWRATSDTDMPGA